MCTTFLPLNAALSLLYIPCGKYPIVEVFRLVNASKRSRNMRGSSVYDLFFFPLSCFYARGFFYCLDDDDNWRWR